MVSLTSLFLLFELIVLDAMIATMVKEVEKKRQPNAFQKGILNVTWMLIGFMIVMVPIVSTSRIDSLTPTNQREGSVHLRQGHRRLEERGALQHQCRSRSRSRNASRHRQRQSRARRSPAFQEASHRQASRLGPESRRYDCSLQRQSMHPSSVTLLGY